MSRQGAPTPKREPVTGPLADALRSWRTLEAKARKVPAYVVLLNRALAAIVDAQPTTLAALAALPGLGESKIKRYGDTLLNIVRQHAAPAPANGGQMETEDEEYERVKAKQAIRAAMMGKRMTEARIATVTELPAALVARALASLVEQKQITQRDGKWSLVKKDS
jgi:ribonuclease D